jgi:hypothetical protein
VRALGHDLAGRRARRDPSAAVAVMASRRGRAVGIGWTVMVTEIGFVSLLVAGLGALAGGLGYLALRIARGRW